MKRHRHIRLEALVAHNLRGAQLRNWKLTSEDGGILERVYVVLSQRGDEYSTHRAVINDELDEAALMWGHYFRGPNAVADANKDFVNRIAEET